ncbi:MAG TPA: hypothetical protein VGN78_01335 [Solirubrobacteraceae bacterium]|nr:hypothetical protein [Solirubrobacteraceae bacterium]
MSAVDDDLLGRLRDQPRTARLLDALAGVAGAHLVGGAVRDLLLGGEAVDLDVVVEGDASAAARTAAERLGGRVREHERFGTATVEAEDLTFDVARARRERYPAPGALPEVEPASLEDDLLRRDFTVNALAVALGPPTPGAVHGAPRSREDLDARQLRVFHDDSFRDDPTRLLRLVRYATRLRFAIEPRTDELARAAVAAGAPATVSGGRIGDELRLLLREPEPNTALRLAGEIGLDRALHPALAPDPDIAERARALLPANGRGDLVILAAATRGFDRDALAAWLDDLEFPAGERDVVVAAALGAAALGRRLAAATRPSEIAAAARGHSPEAIVLAAAVVPEAVAGARRWLDELRHVALDIDGEDVLAAGVPEGPEVGRALAAALAHKLDGEVAGRDAELAAALAAIGRE